MSDFGDVLQTVSEQILHKTKIKPHIARQLIQWVYFLSQPKSLWRLLETIFLLSFLGEKNFLGIVDGEVKQSLIVWNIMKDVETLDMAIPILFGWLLEVVIISLQVDNIMDLYHFHLQDYNQQIMQVLTMLEENFDNK